MLIGLDFDNTIVSYDALFHKVALEQSLIDESVPVNKVAVRDHLRRTNREPLWTEMQGYVYGARMNEAEAYPDVCSVLKNALDAGHDLTIVSHKTRHPFLGPSYDLHAAAQVWINHHLRFNGQLLISEESIYFELTKEEKIARIEKLDCDLFLDDLPEILMFPNFPDRTRKLLFDPEVHHADFSAGDVISSWNAFDKWLRSL